MKNIQSLGTDNTHLIGLGDSREQLETPSLIVDLDALEHNIAIAANFARTSGKSFWPHLKAHKCVEIARLQHAAGVDGFCVANIGEAEVFAQAGLGPLLITSTFCTRRQIERIGALLAQGTSLSVVVDDAEVINNLSRLCSEQKLTLEVLIDIDMGRQRAGCATLADAIELANQCHRAEFLQLAGIQAYAGQLSHMHSFSDRKHAALEAEKRARLFSQKICEATGIQPLRCTGGSTGSYMMDIHNTALTELQWGTYLFMDEEYANIEYESKNDGEGESQKSENPFVTSLFVSSRVISARSSKHVTLDAGDKRFASKYGVPPRPVRGASANATFTPVSDEHGCLVCQPLPTLGALVELAVPHSDPTINLFDFIHVFRGEVLTDIWRIDARGVY